MKTGTRKIDNDANKNGASFSEREGEGAKEEGGAEQKAGGECLLIHQELSGPRRFLLHFSLLHTNSLPL
jgi:hypothetical protein